MNLTRAEAQALGRRRAQPVKEPLIQAQPDVDLMAGVSDVIARVTFLGEPLSKQRPRFVRKNGSVFTPQETQEREKAIGMTVAAAGIRPLERFACGIRIAFYVGTNQRKDIDNMTKLVFDGLNGVAWADDSQVREMAVWCRAQPAKPRTEIVLYRLSWEVGPSSRACAICRKSFPVHPSWRERKFCSRACSAQAQQNRLMKTCANCREPMQVKARSERRYCSMACRRAGETEAATCARCGKEFRRARWYIHRRQRTFCSPGCLTAQAILDRKGRSYGRCCVCGGGTSRKEYKRCDPCRLAKKEATA